MPASKNIVYNNISADGHVHIDDIHYQVERDFRHSILFLRLDRAETDHYNLSLTLKSRHAKNNLPLLNEVVDLTVLPEVFEKVNLFQQARRNDELHFRNNNESWFSLEQLEGKENALQALLFRTLFQGDILTVCKDFVDLLEKRKIEELILAISSDDERILNLPLEMVLPLFFSTKLGAERKSLAVARFGLVRTTEANLISFDMRGKSASATPLKMLFVTALPEDMNEQSKMLEIEEEQKRLIEAIGSFEATGGAPKIVIEFLDTASLTDINEALTKHQHDILHISGHGSYSKKIKKGVLHLENELGEHQEVSGKELGECLRHHQCVKLLILSACETAIAGEGNGVVEQLSAFGLPAMVAMRFPVTDIGAKIFTTALYESLAQGLTLTQALANARESLWQRLLEQQRNSPQRAHLAEWFTPVVYLNQYTASLVDPAATYSLPESFYPRSSFFKTKNTRLIGSGFIGRKRYLNQLRRYFTQGQHVVLHGLGGMGKTTLAEAFAQNYDNRSHELIIFRNGPQLSEKYILDELLARLESATTANPNVIRQLQQYLKSKATPEEKLQALLDNYLADRKSILVFDNFEDVQQNEEGQQGRSIGSPALTSFMRHLCAHAPKHCHLLFTTRYMISDLVEQVVHLSLDKMSYAEQYRLSNFSESLQKIPLSVRQDVFKRLDGHPRAYEFLEALLKKDPTASWDSLVGAIGSVETQVWENLLLQKIYEGLSIETQSLLQQAAVCLGRSPLAALAAISGQAETELAPLLQHLHEWSLCQWDAENQSFEVHRLTRAWVLDKLVAPAQQKAWALAAGNYYWKKEEDVPITEAELAFLYFEQAEAWEDFARVAFVLNDHYQLVGFNERALELNEAVLAQPVSEKNIGRALFHKGQILQLFGQPDKALVLFQQSLATYRKLGNQKEEGAVLAEIGQIYQNRGDYDNALAVYEKSLAIRQEIKNKRGEGVVLNNISQVYRAKGQHDQALSYLIKSLAISQEVDDRRQEGVALNNIGQFYRDKEEYDLALGYFEKSLEIRQEVKDRGGEGVTLNNIGETHLTKGKYDLALTYLEKSLAIVEEIGDRRAESITLDNISYIHYQRGNIAEANEYTHRALKIFQEIGDVISMAAAMNNMGSRLYEQKKYEEAIPLLRKAYGIFEQIGSLQVNFSKDGLDAIREEIGEARFQEIVAGLREGGE